MDFCAYRKSWHLGAKLAPAPMLDLALFAPRRELAPWDRFILFYFYIIAKNV
jgi:hypothetical protein